MEKVVVGLTGNLYSAIVASKLIDDGYEVIALFNDDGRYNVNSAINIAGALNVPLYVLNNGSIKDFIENALYYGADYIATGHYARINGCKLYRGIDNICDESYKVAHIKIDYLKSVILPLGELTMDEIASIKDIKFNGILFDKKDNSYEIKKFNEYNTIYLKDVNFISPNHPTFLTIKLRSDLNKELQVFVEYLDDSIIKVKNMNGTIYSFINDIAYLYLGEQCLGCGFVSDFVEKD